jgi:uncharacterized protein (TIGR02217 family)
MAYWLADRRNGQDTSWLKRFDARFWTVDFPRPMMASVVTTSHDTLRVDACFYRKNDLAGLIWWSEDRYDHPLLGYETSRDFRTCTLSFRWRSAGVVPLDAVHGPTLTIEGRDADGEPASWYVRLWNYATGTPEDAEIVLDFAALQSGFNFPGAAVWAGDVDRMFISLAPPGYDEVGGELAIAVEGWAELSQIACSGSGSVLEIGDVLLPPHRLRIATGYDDAYHLTPARLLRNMLHLGYRALINHYVGMSHYFRLAGGLVTSVGGVLNAPCAAWHQDFAQRAKALGYELILSLSYELFNEHCPASWKQRAADGSPALTGWVPPSTLLSPAHAGAMSYLQDVAASFATIAQDSGLPVRFQVGEPWWWLDADGELCVHDEAAKAAHGGIAPTPEQAGTSLAASTTALTNAVKDVVPDAETLILVYLPTVLGRVEHLPALVPAEWATPAFDVLQLEDYDWVTSGNMAAGRRGADAMTERLGYPVAEQHYLSGFVLRPEDAAQWKQIAEAIERARERGVAEVFVWALPQVLRDGFTWFDEEKDVDAFADVSFPLEIGREASVEAVTSTAVAAGAGGREQRNTEWAEARLRFDAGPGVRSDRDLAALLSFFRARHGPAQAFRFRDPLDGSSAEPGEELSPYDQIIGIGDGVETSYALTKNYDGVARRITRPVGATVRLAIDGVETSAWRLGPLGLVEMDEAPDMEAIVTAGFRFDVPVRFAEDRLAVSRATFEAGDAVSVPLIEVREA